MPLSLNESWSRPECQIFSILKELVESVIGIRQDQHGLFGMILEDLGDEGPNEGFSGSYDRR